MKKQTIKISALFLVIILFIPYVGYAECGENSTTAEQSTKYFSQLNADELYHLYVENVLMNNPYIHQMNHLGYNYNSLSHELFLIESNYEELELYVMAQEESNILFQEWIKNEEDRIDFLAKMNGNNNPSQSDNNYQVAIEASK